MALASPLMKAGINVYEDRETLACILAQKRQSKKRREIERAIRSSVSSANSHVDLPKQHVEKRVKRSLSMPDTSIFPKTPQRKIYLKAVPEHGILINKGRLEATSNEMKQMPPQKAQSLDGSNKGKVRFGTIERITYLKRRPPECHKYVHCLTEAFEEETEENASGECIPTEAKADEEVLPSVTMERTVMRIPSDDQKPMSEEELERKQKLEELRERQTSEEAQYNALALKTLQQCQIQDQILISETETDSDEAASSDAASIAQSPSKLRTVLNSTILSCVRKQHD